MPSYDISDATRWFETDDLNVTYFAEGQTPASVNDGARSVSGALKRFYNRINPTQGSGGSSNAYTLTYTVAPAAYEQAIYSFVPSFTNTGAATININSLGAKSVTRPDNTLLAGDIIGGTIAMVAYNGTKFILLNPAGAVTGYLSTGGGVMTGDLDFSSPLTPIGVRVSSMLAIHASGTTVDTATQLGWTEWQEIDTASASANGVILPQVVGTKVGRSIKIFNRSAVTINVYPFSGQYIEVAVLNAPYSIPSGKMQTFNAISGIWFVDNTPSLYS